MSSRTPRNKLSRLPLEHQVAVTRMLLDRETYDDVRAYLRAEGVPEREIPKSNRAFAAFKRSPDYLSSKERALHAEYAMAEQRILADAIERGGGLEAAASTALVPVFKQLTQALTMSKLDPKDLTRVANSLATAARASVYLAKNRREQAEADAGAEGEPEGTDYSKLQAAVDALLGGGS